MYKNKLSIGFLVAPLLSLPACGNETADIRDAVLAVSADNGVDVGGEAVTQVWIMEQKDGECVVLDDSVTVTVNGKSAKSISRGSAPGIGAKYDRYAGCEPPLFRFVGTTPQEGSKYDVRVTGGGLSASTLMVFTGGAWSITQCQGVKSCCASDVSASPIKCVDAATR